MTEQQKQPVAPPADKPSTRAELEQRRGGVLGKGPSGAVYRIRKVNIQRLAAEGALPRELREMALRAVAKSNGRDPMGALAGELSQDKIDELMAEEKAQNDKLVLATVVEPPLTIEDLGTGELDDDPMLPVVDYEWLLAVATGRTDTDAEDRSLWGPEPIDRMIVFRHHHECPEDCPACEDVRDEFRAVLMSDAG